MIDGKTRLIGLMGNPVEHTLSPVIHNGISKRMDILSVYVPFKVEENGLEKAVKGAYELNILGLNVTVPHKNAVIDSLVAIDAAAKDIGAVNTLVRDDNLKGYKGYNTDMLGLRRQIVEDGINLKDQTVVVLGAGGAAKAVVYMCLLEGAKTIYLLNRTVEKAEQIATDLNHVFENDLKKKGYQGVIPMAMSNYALLKEENFIAFQATSIGLSPNANQVVIEDEEFYKKVRVGVDLIYNPANTKFMQLVTKQGGKAYNALKMLLYQGVIAYELWHNTKVPLDIIEDIYVELKRQVYKKDNIVLIGFMGSGKTTIGKEFAKRHNMQFVDTDAYIEEKAGKTIADIFKDDGEEAFRQIETSCLEELKEQMNHTVFSTGGGMPLKVQNARLLKEIGKVFYLTAANQVIYERVKTDTKRPLLQGDNPYDKICELMKERAPLYERAADCIVDTNSNDIEEVITKIEKQILS